MIAYKIKLICRLTLLLVVGLQNLKEDIVLIISNLTKYNLLKLKIIEYYIDCFSLFSPFFLYFFQHVLSNSNPLCATSVLVSFKSMKFTTPFWFLFEL